MRKKVNIIGAGMAGLCAGCYLQMNGFDVEIYELNTLPGGLCTTWERKNYKIDYCIHWLVGSTPRDKFYYLWNELIDMKSIKFHDQETIIRVEGKDGDFLDVFTDIDILEIELLKKAPEDSEAIKEFAECVRKTSKLDMPLNKPNELMGFLDGIQMASKFLPYITFFRKWVSIKTADYIKRFKNPLVIKMMEYAFMPEMSALVLFFTFAWFNNKSAGYPIGGSQYFSNLFEKRFLELGGKVHYEAKVDKILTENAVGIQKVIGIKLENGDKHFSDYVISAADGYSTLFEMLEGKYLTAEQKRIYSDWDPFPSIVLVGLGVNKKLDDMPHHICFPLEKNIVVDETSIWEELDLKVYNFDPTLAPEGKCVMNAMFTTYNYDYWVQLKKNDLHKYKLEKDRIAKEVIEAIDKRFPGIKEKIEMIDVSTPSSLIRYTNNWKGSFEGWLITPKTRLKQLKLSHPELQNFYMVGQWVAPGGGLPSCILTGRQVTQLICHKEKVEFKAEQYKS